MSISKHITDTRFAASFNLERLMKISVDFLIKNRNVIADRETLTPVFAVKPMIATPMSRLFTQCLETGYIDEFATIARIPDKSLNIPDIFTMNIVIDYKDCPAASPLTPFTELHDKMLVNIANLTRVNSLGEYTVSSVHELHSMFVKAMLSRSYKTSDMWLTPIMCSYIIKSYSLSVASVVARSEGLNYNELLTVAMVFALFMCQRLSPRNTDLAMPPMFLNLNYLGTRADLLSFCETARDVSQDGLTITDCCELISRLGPARLKKYNEAVFYRQCYSLGSYNDVISTYLAVEYPPYWVWFLIQIQSGIKLGGLSNQLKTHNLLNAGKQFVNDLIITESLYEHR